MLDLIVLGQVPGISWQLTFAWIASAMVVILLIVEIVLLRRDFRSRKANQITAIKNKDKLSTVS